LNECHLYLYNICNDKYLLRKEIVVRLSVKPLLSSGPLERGFARDRSLFYVEDKSERSNYF